MTRRTTLYRFAAAAALAAAGLAGCDGRESTPLTVDRPDATVRSASSAGAGAAATANATANAADNPEVSGWLAGLKQVTVKFHDIDAAAAAGWDTQITGCMEMPGMGGMGYHYGKPGLIDGVAEDLAPELLLYEPQKNGRPRLVAVEYIVPYAIVPRDGPAPSLHGVPLHHNDGFGLWVLHAWVWKHNPAGMFSDWNPDVSCAFAS